MVTRDRPDVRPGVRLGAHQHGKAEVRLVKVGRDTAVHTIEDLTVSTQLRGEFDAAFTEGDNSHVHTTDTQKNSIYALAKEHGIGSPERFLLLLAEHWTAQPFVTGGRWSAQQHRWERIEADGRPHGHAFHRTGAETRTSVVQRDGERTWVVSGLEDLTLLKSTGSEFHGFPRDRFTTLADTDDRILATSVTARWRYTSTDIDFDATYDSIRATLLETFATVHSLALQQSVYEMAGAVLDAHDDVAELRVSCPNKHHFLVDLAPFGIDNPGEVFVATDRPYGLIEAVIARDGVPEAPEAWATVTGFC
jgi:urate oxidase